MRNAKCEMRNRAQRMSNVAGDARNKDRRALMSRSQSSFPFVFYFHAIHVRVMRDNVHVERWVCAYADAVFNTDNGCRVF
jgi:hypothetical protein